MGCLVAVFAGAFPRLGVFFIWLARPALFSSAFGGGWLLPLLGFIFLPLTTLMYAILWTPGVGLVGWDWFWLFLAAGLDVSTAAASGYANRDRMPSYASA